MKRGRKGGKRKDESGKEGGKNGEGSKRGEETRGKRGGGYDLANSPEIIYVYGLFSLLTIPTGKIDAHSFVLGAEFGTQCTYTYVNNSEHQRI